MTVRTRKGEINISNNNVFDHWESLRAIRKQEAYKFNK